MTGMTQLLRPLHLVTRFGWSIVLTYSVMCSQTQASEPRGWEKYAGYLGARGLHLKPAVVLFDRHGVSVNQQGTTAEGAYRLLKRSQHISPVPDILVRADHRRSLTARHFMKRVRDAGMCEDRKCFYRFSR